MKAMLCAALVGATLPLAGCVRALNDRPVLGGNTPLPAIAGEVPTSGDRGAATHTRLDRVNWRARVVLVPVDGAVHGPSWRSYRTRAGDAARQAGLYPTAETALEIDGGSWRANATAAAFEHLGALGEVALMPVRAFTDPLTADRQTGVVYKRKRPGGWSSGGQVGPAEQDG